MAEAYIAESSGSSSGGMTAQEREEAVQLMKAMELEETVRDVKFKWTDDINTLYQIGDDVIPSDNGRSTVKAVVFATSLMNGRTVSDLFFFVTYCLRLSSSHNFFACF